tara:strand:- start:91 stop:465 length:375 start_codon:yes stop_codon:yes gene_type:complete
MDLKGTVIKVLPKRQISEKFALREFVIKTDDKYPQEIIMQVTQERCELLDNIIEGEQVQAFVNVRGRSWTNPQGEVKYFNTLEAWKISNESAQSFDNPVSIKGNIESNFKEDIIDNLVDNDLPF